MDWVADPASLEVVFALCTLLCTRALCPQRGLSCFIAVAHALALNESGRYAVEEQDFLEKPLCIQESRGWISCFC